MTSSSATHADGPNASTSTNSVFQDDADPDGDIVNVETAVSAGDDTQVLFPVMEQL